MVGRKMMMSAATVMVLALAVPSVTAAALPAPEAVSTSPASACDTIQQCISETIGNVVDLAFLVVDLVLFNFNRTYGLLETDCKAVLGGSCPMPPCGGPGC